MTATDGRIGNPLTPRPRTLGWPIGDLMREARVAAEMTQEEVARRMFVSVHTIGAWESGYRRLSVDMLEAYLKVVGGTITLGDRR